MTGRHELDRHELHASEQSLLAEATAIRRQAYAPYSGFLVGAALQAADGTIFTGANIENASYSATICAERVALPAAMLAGHREFTAVAVVGAGSAPCTPCGVCRQSLFEVAPGLTVIAAGETGRVLRLRLDTDLLPYGFGPDRLG